MNRIELSAGPVEYEDTGGSGPVLLLLHGVLMDETLWAAVVADLPTDYRCVAPCLPLGAHRIPVNGDADLSLAAMAGLVDELLDRLDLHDVTLVGNDTGGALAQLVAAGGQPRVGRLVLVSCDAFDNFPPGLTGRALFAAGKLPVSLFGLFMQQMRLRPVRRLPIAFGWLTKRGDPATARWVRALLATRAVRGDLVRALRAFAADREVLARAAPRLAEFPGPVLVVWAAEDRVMPPAHGHRLADLVAHGTLATVDDSYTLIPLDQPLRLAELLTSEVGGTQKAETTLPAQ